MAITMGYDRATRTWSPELTCDHCRQPIEGDGRLTWPTDRNGTAIGGEVSLVHAGCHFQFAGAKGGADRWPTAPLETLADLATGRAQKAA